MLRTREESKRRYQTKAFSIGIKYDGTFRVEDVPAGTYFLNMTIMRPETGGGKNTANRQNNPRHQVVGTISREVIVPEMPGGRSDEPLDLGTLQLETPRKEKVKAEVKQEKTVGMDAIVQPMIGKAVVRRIQGHATYRQYYQSEWISLRKGMVLGAGVIIKTADDSMVDLYLGTSGPVVRVTASTELGLDKISNGRPEYELDKLFNLRPESSTIPSRVNNSRSLSPYHLTSRPLIRNTANLPSQSNNTWYIPYVPPMAGLSR